MFGIKVLRVFRVKSDRIFHSGYLSEAEQRWIKMKKEHTFAMFRYKFMFWPMHYLILAFVKWLGFISRTDLQHTNCVSFIKNFIIRSLACSFILSLFVFLLIFFSFYYPTFGQKPSTCVCVEWEKLNENPETFQVKRFVAYNIQKALSFNISYALKKLHEKSFRRPSETNENSLLFFFHFPHALHAMTIYFCCHSIESALNRKEKKKKLLQEKFYHKVFWL